MVSSMQKIQKVNPLSLIHFLNAPKHYDHLPNMVLVLRVMPKTAPTCQDMDYVYTLKLSFSISNILTLIYGLVSRW